MRLPFERHSRLLARYLARHRLSVALLGALVLANTALQLINPQIVRGFIDATQSGASQRQLVEAAALFAGVALAQRAAAVAVAYLGTGIGAAATNALRADLLRHCIGLDMPFHRRHSPGQLIERIGGDVARLANFFSEFTVRMVGSVLLVVGILGLLVREDARVGLALGVYALLTFAALRVSHSLAVHRWTAARQSSAEQTGFLEERLAGTEDIRANGAQSYVMRGFTQRALDLLRRERTARLTSNVAFVSTNFLFALGYVLGLGLGAALYAAGGATVGTVYLIAAYTAMLFAPLEVIRGQVQDFQRATASVDRVEALFRLRPDVRDAPDAVPVPPPRGPPAVEFRDVSFRYGADEAGEGQTPGGAARGNVLDAVSFHVAPGRVLGVLGRTGSGKTTLARLLFRLYDPGGGAVRVGDVDVRAVPLATLRQRVGMVTQDVQLFQASVRDNVAFFDSRVPDHRVAAVLDQVGLGGWRRRLPEGLDTPLAGGGQGLSAGEAQLLALARTFLRDPGVLILDEASSRLDPMSERLLERALDRLLTDRTGIVIAHRLATVRRCDDILILEDGRVVEHGPRAALEADPHSRFSRLLRAGLELDLDTAAAPQAEVGR